MGESTLAKKVKSLKIMGGASRMENWYSVGKDHWGLNNLHASIPETDQHLLAGWFQMHSDEMWRGGRNGGRHIDWLAQEHPFPIYMQDEHKDVPASKEYPIKDVLDLWPAQLGKPIFSNTFCYMMALGILKGYKEIELYGVGLISVIEAYAESLGFGMWIGIAGMNGVKVTDISGRIAPFLYGYMPRVPQWWMPRNVAEALIVDESLEARSERSDWERSQYAG